MFTPKITQPGSLAPPPPQVNPALPSLAASSPLPPQVTPALPSLAARLHAPTPPQVTPVLPSPAASSRVRTCRLSRSATTPWPVSEAARYECSTTVLQGVAGLPLVPLTLGPPTVLKVHGCCTSWTSPLPACLPSHQDGPSALNPRPHPLPQGTWTLRIVDLSTKGLGAGIDLKSWTLVLCPLLPEVPGEVRQWGFSAL